MTTVDDREYLPAMGRTALLPLYDPFTRLLGVRDAHWRLVAQAGIEPGATVLEIGCGTGNVLLLAARAVPGRDADRAGPGPGRAGRRRTEGAAGRGDAAARPRVRRPAALPGRQRGPRAVGVHAPPPARGPAARRRCARCAGCSRRAAACTCSTSTAARRRRPVGCCGSGTSTPPSTGTGTGTGTARGGPARPRHARHGARRAARRRLHRRRRRRARRDAAGRLQLLPRLALNRPQSTGRYVASSYGVTWRR